MGARPARCSLHQSRNRAGGTCRTSGREPWGLWGGRRLLSPATRSVCPSNPRPEAPGQRPPCLVRHPLPSRTPSLLCDLDASPAYSGPRCPHLHVELSRSCRPPPRGRRRPGRLCPAPSVLPPDWPGGRAPRLRTLDTALPSWYFQGPHAGRGLQSCRGAGSLHTSPAVPALAASRQEAGPAGSHGVPSASQGSHGQQAGESPAAGRRAGEGGRKSGPPARPQAGSAAPTELGHPGLSPGARLSPSGCRCPGPRPTEGARKRSPHRFRN
ncbi:hypothetical protein H1C71_012067 [Ictidomys tridecemlineatus]|nr:hypothetical protein H1C71_012067 [Ictidomys tridecemlineatus]